MHAAMLRGGSGWSTKCKLSIERRTIPDETEEQIRNESQEVIETEILAQTAVEYCR